MLSIWIATLIISAAVYVTISLVIMSELKKREVPVNFFLMRLLLPWYAHRYSSLHKQETGRRGALFYGWVLSANAMLVFAVILILTEALH
jgi:hypothetical protein